MKVHALLKVLNLKVRWSPVDALVNAQLPIGWMRGDSEEVRVVSSMPGANFGFGCESEL